MKKIVKGLGLLSITIIAFTACKKQDFTQSVEMGSSNSYSIEDGIMVFDSQKSYQQTIIKLAKMTSDERMSWGESNGFQSKMVQFEDVIRAEEEFDRVYFAGVDENLNSDELAAIGKPVAYSDIYNEAIGSGLIVQNEEEDGATSFQLNICDRSAAYVLNTKGMVVVNGELFQYGQNTVKIMPYDGANSIQQIENALSSDESKNIAVINVSEKATISFVRGDIFNPSSNSVIWYYNSGTERFKHVVSFSSNNFISGGQSKVYCLYYTEAIGEKKLFSKWKVRSSYKPIYRLGGSWSHFYYKKLVSSFDPPILSTYLGPGAGTTSPFSITFGNANSVSVPLYPSGTYVMTGSYYFYTPVDISSGAHWTGSFWGGPSGYSTNYYR